MKREILWFEEATAYPLAEQRFIKACGFDLSKPKHQRMLKRGSQVRADGLAGIRLGGVFSFWGAEYFHQGKLTLGELEIHCHYFEQLPEEAVSGLYLYLLTAGECYFSSEENIVDFLYADMWGTAYVDAAAELLRDRIRKDLESRMGDSIFGIPSSAYLSEEFGPGYYGMSVQESKKIMSLLQGEELGIAVKDNGLIIPQKSCTGLYFVLNDAQVRIEPGCMKCRGTASGCGFCRFSTSDKERREGDAE
ncbi:hypothetical protein Ami103574_12105 [Aminipila butyrica]|uniref:Uncharacterized protein n=1 Tax=Aminipila butyrica TaxID=433296 RepID=A0A858BY08_9FIRM|nr:vitamin B12 dependent-methionine synthase activation domain-containing protein [Aminipila butyrica]QIB69995.1 hypothetical protein Ami103574_12105 [Aminipila butyrica]